MSFVIPTASAYTSQSSQTAHSYPPFTTTFTPAPECPWLTIDNPFTCNGSAPCSATGYSNIGNCGDQPSCFPASTFNNIEAVIQTSEIHTYSPGYACPLGWGVAASALFTDGVWCCPSGYTFATDFQSCEGIFTSGTLVYKNGCSTVTTVAFGPMETGMVDLISYPSSAFPASDLTVTASMDGIFLLGQKEIDLDDGNMEAPTSSISSISTTALSSGSSISTTALSSGSSISTTALSFGSFISITALSSGRRNDDGDRNGRDGDDDKDDGDDENRGGNEMVATNERSTNDSRTTTIGVAIGVTLGVLLLGIGFFLVIRYRRRRMSKTGEEDSQASQKVEEGYNEYGANKPELEGSQAPLRFVMKLELDANAVRAELEGESPKNGLPQELDSRCMRAELEG
ncbi:hypothetical protein GGR54DRAFT_615072 [Hypoxylon sp. NC1633]|nr:hypothetical protein GGR54DRAFT_615072 [Hypoxylon sp. NC1633]